MMLYNLLFSFCLYSPSFCFQFCFEFSKFLPYIFLLVSPIICFLIFSSRIFIHYFWVLSSLLAIPFELEFKISLYQMGNFRYLSRNEKEQDNIKADFFRRKKSRLKWHFHRGWGVPYSPRMLFAAHSFDIWKLWVEMAEWKENFHWNLHISLWLMAIGNAGYSDANRPRGKYACESKKNKERSFFTSNHRHWGRGGALPV